jgi:hypothetical protein
MHARIISKRHHANSSEFVLLESLDRFQESHFWIHSLQRFYHEANLFRWHLNAFLKAFKEVPRLIEMGLQNRPGFSVWYRPHRDKLNNDPLISFLSSQRDFVVHRGMLGLKSSGTIGVTEGSGIKIGLTIPVNPFEDSDEAMERYLKVVASGEDFLDLLVPDEESVPCVQRVWRMDQFDDDIVKLSALAWLRTGELVNLVMAWLGHERPPLALDCLHEVQKVQFRLYDREQLRKRLQILKSSREDSPAIGY